jgi:predicted phosphodiesterase
MKRVFFIPDCHIPYVDRMAWAVMTNALRAFRPDVLVVLGDFIDCHAVSSHSKDPLRPLRLADEIEGVHVYLDELDAVGVPEKVFVLGNHEDRLRRYLWDRAPALFGCVSVPQLLRLSERDWEVVEYGDGRWVGKVYCTHDMGKSGKYAVKQALADAGCNIVIGHLHRMEVTYDGSALGDTHVGACFGWLARVDVATDYKKRLLAMKEYQLGFGVGYLEDDGTVHLSGVPIVDGHCVLEGEAIWP